MRIRVMSRGEAKTFLVSMGNSPELNHMAFISICDIDKDPISFDPWVKNLCLKFNDEDWEDMGTTNPNKFMTEGHAWKILRFVKENEDKVDTFIVNCFAGISRSGAIGLWLTRRFGNDVDEFLREHSWVNPNKFVLSLLEKVSAFDSCKKVDKDESL